MAKTIKITSGKQVISIESDNTGVPDVTKDVGPDMIKLQDDAMAAPNAENAEFNAAVPDSPVEKEEKPQEATDKSNESGKVTSFMDIREKHLAEALALEGFTLSPKKMSKSYSTVKAFLSSPEAKGALNEAKKYAEKKGLKIASSTDISSRKIKQNFFNKISAGNLDKGISPDLETITVEGTPFLVLHAQTSKAVKGNEVVSVFLAFVKMKDDGTGKYSIKSFAGRVNIRKDASTESCDFNFSVEDDEEEKNEAEKAAGDGDGESTDTPVTPEETDNTPAEEPAPETPSEEPAPAADPAPEAPAETPATEPEAPELASNAEGGDTCPACGGDGCDNCDGDGMVNDGAGEVTESDGVTTIDTGDTVITITTNNSTVEETPAECGDPATTAENEVPAPAPTNTAAAEEAPVEEPAPEEPASAENTDTKAADASIESFFAELGL